MRARRSCRVSRVCLESDHFRWRRALAGAMICFALCLSAGCQATPAGAARPAAAYAPADQGPSGPRALVALLRGDCTQAFLSWRRFADDGNAGFHVHRQFADQAPVQVTDAPVRAGSSFVDRLAGDLLAAPSKLRWYLSRAGAKTDFIASARLPDNPCQGYVTVANDYPTHGRAFTFGDLDGDRQTDLIARYSSVTIDPYFRLWRPSESTYTIRATSMSGKPLWVYDMGESIETGIWYSPYLVYDLDQDGSAELIVKGGEPGVKRKDIADASGRVIKGAEYLNIVSGKDGVTLLGQAPWPNRQGFGSGRGQPFEQYNRYSRNLLAIAYLDGRHPHVVVVRGTYDKHKVAAYRYSRGAGLQLVWYWENKNPRLARAGDDANFRSLKKWWGQGAHTLRVGDIDSDGKDEVIVGAFALDHDGTPLWSLERGHVDHIHLGDLVPNSPGLELYYGTEQGHKSGGMGMIKAGDAQRLWQYNGRTKHIHKEGLCADLLAQPEGHECYSGEADLKSFWLWGSGGESLPTKELAGLAPKAAYWSDRPQKALLRVTRDLNAPFYAELVDVQSGAVIDRLEWPASTKQEDRQYLKPLAVVDLFGDWREEIVVADRGRLVLYTSRLAATTSLPWLMSDHTYRMAALLSSMGYYQQPLLGYDPAPLFSNAITHCCESGIPNNVTQP